MSFWTLRDDRGAAISALDNSIAKKELRVRNAWEIGLDDIDSTGIMTDDDPIIPSSRRDDAPVLELLRRRRECDAEK